MLFIFEELEIYYFLTGDLSSTRYFYKSLLLFSLDLSEEEGEKM